MHKDFPEYQQNRVSNLASSFAMRVYNAGHSLGIAREAWINAFDKAAEELEATDGQAQA